MAFGSVVSAAPSGATAAATASLAAGEHHHYTMNARVRPLLVFWISKSNVGDAMTLRRQEGNEAQYSLLIGSDPERAPRRINRWGYIDENLSGPNSTLIGLMTESNEDSIEQAEANIKKQDGQRVFKVIHGSIAGDKAQSVVTAVPAPADCNFRHVRTLLDLARQDAHDGKTRSIRLAPGTRPGFLAALVDLMHTHVEQWKMGHRVEAGTPISYAYHGKIYQLRATKTHVRSTITVGSKTYRHAIASEFEIRNAATGELTRFAMTYGTEGGFAEVPLAASFQPRWWLEIDLALDDSIPGPTLAATEMAR
jgi:hypothetical protein